MPGVGFRLVFGLVLGSAAMAQELRIAEFQAANNNTLRDEDGEASDWIELWNPGREEIDLGGWFLTDDPAQLNKWRLPSRRLAAGDRVLVFASQKHRVPPDGELHASFRLEARGEYLAVVRPDGRTVAHEYAPAFPPQREDGSFGIARDVLDPALLAAGASVRWHVPVSGALGDSWTGGSEPFDDAPGAGWSAGPTGVGFDLGGGELQPLLYYDFNDASNPETVADQSTNGHAGSITNHLALAGSGGNRTPMFTEDAAGRSGQVGDRALDFGLRGDGGVVVVEDAVAGMLDSAVTNDTITISLWALGSTDQPANDVIFWGSSAADGTGTRSLNAHIPWSDGVIYWDTAGCCNETQRVFKPEPDATRWRGQWTHWVFVKDGDTKRIYQNGELFLEGENTTNLTPVRGFFLGCAVNSGEWSYGGRVDDFAVWDVALQAEQARALARGVSPLAISSLTPYIATDVAAGVHDVHSSLYTRLVFDAPAVGDANVLVLRLLYNDGFVAYLNGVEVARRNAPLDLAFDSRATTARASGDSTRPEEIDLSAFLGELRPGRNVLSFHLLNAAISSPDLLLLPELFLARDTPDRFLIQPTPGAPNGRGVSGFVAPPMVSVAPGLKNAPFEVTLATSTPGATVYYTLDATPPTPARAGTLVYSRPIAISRTTTLRALAIKDAFEPSPSITATYIFPAQVLAQSANVAGLPAMWSGNWPADYGMDPDVVSRTLAGFSVEDALTAIPTVALTFDPGDLWDASRGMYFNAEAVLERAVSMELLPFDGAEGFQINASARIHGNTSRLHHFTPKHSFRVTFKSQYGPAKLRHRLFDSSEVDRFDQLVLRGMSTDSWCVMDGWDGPEPGTKRWFRQQSLYLREQWMKDSQHDMGQAGLQAFFVHVYLNGLYWGVYHLTERPTDSFHAAHFGGEREEYDVLKDFAELQSGTGDAWRQLMQLASAGLATPAAYERIQGNNPDGSRNPAYPRLLDVDNLIDYMILHIYASADDWPNHNWWGGRRRGDLSEGFKFFAWDQEITHISLAYLHTSWGPLYEEASAYDTPSHVHAQLRANSTYRLRFADRVHRHLLGRGALTPNASAERLLRRADEINQAIVAESARWGDSKRAVPLTREKEWLAEIDRLMSEHFPALETVALNRFKRVQLYPTVAAPSLEPPGGRILAGTSVSLGVALGTLHYTLDGSDPRAPNGSPAAGAAQGVGSVTLARTTTIKARARVGNTWSALVEEFYYTDVPLRLTEIQYHPAAAPGGSLYSDEDFEFLELQNVGEKSIELAGIKLTRAVDFDFSAGVVLSLAPGKLVVVVRNHEAFVARYGGEGISIAGEYSGELSNRSERLVLVGPAGEPIHDFWYFDRWFPPTDGLGPSLVIRNALAAPETWGEASSWQPSRRALGSPGSVDEALPVGGWRRPGDFNSDGKLQLSDAVGLLVYLFIDASQGLPCQGDLLASGNTRLLDANGDTQVDLTDAVYVLGYLFLGGAAPQLGTDCVRVEGCAEICAD